MYLCERAGKLRLPAPVIQAYDHDATVLTEALYKRILCNRKQTLLWVVLQRKQLKFVVENFAVGVVRYMRELSLHRS